MQLLYRAAATGIGPTFHSDRQQTTRFVTGTPESPLTLNAFQTRLKSASEKELPRATWVPWPSSFAVLLHYIHAGA